MRRGQFAFFANCDLSQAEAGAKAQYKLFDAARKAQRVAQAADAQSVETGGQGAAERRQEQAWGLRTTHP